MAFWENKVELKSLVIGKEVWSLLLLSFAFVRSEPR